MSFQGSNKVFFHLKIVGEEVKLLPVHFHFLQKDREWVHNKFDSVIKDFKRLVLDNLDSIARVPAKGAPSYLAFHKIAGGKRITIVYATTKADENTCIVQLNNVLVATSYLCSLCAERPYNTYKVLQNDKKLLSGRDCRSRCPSPRSSLSHGSSR